MLNVLLSVMCLKQSPSSFAQKPLPIHSSFFFLSNATLLHLNAMAEKNRKCNNNSYINKNNNQTISVMITKKCIESKHRGKQAFC